MGNSFNDYNNTQIIISPNKGLIYNAKSVHFTYRIKPMPVYIKQIKKFRKKHKAFKILRKVIKKQNNEDMENKKKIDYIKRLYIIFYKMRTKKLKRFIKKSKYIVKRCCLLNKKFMFTTFDFRFKFVKQITRRVYRYKKIIVRKKKLKNHYKSINWHSWTFIKKKSRKPLGPRFPRHRIFKPWIIKNKNKVMDFIN